jgi:1,4-dihydroxy-2-naphthoate octaprenyltransferase
VWSSGEVEALSVVLALIGGLGAHISVNAFNEYFDFKSGLDFKTTRTPFSGGSGTLPANPEKFGYALAVAIISFAITGAIGLWFVSTRGISLLPLGLVGMFTIFSYTTLLARSPLLCLIAPGVGFGLVMVMGTDFALTGEYSLTSFIASLVPFFLVSNLLLLNQFPDVDPDQSIGRKHLPIAIGKRTSAMIYTIFLLCAYLTIIAGVYLEHFPTTALLGLGTIILAVPTTIGVLRNAEDIQKLVPQMGMNVLINIATPLLVGIGLLIG